MIEEKKKTFIHKILAKFFSILAKFLVFIGIIILTLFIIIKNSPFVLDSRFITIENAENTSIIYEIKNLISFKKSSLNTDEIKIEEIFKNLFLPDKISFLDNEEKSNILVLRNFGLSQDSAKIKNNKLITEIEDYIEKRNLEIKEDILNKADEKYKLAQKNLENIKFELEKLELSKSRSSKTKRQIQQSIITALKTELVRIETQISQLKIISPQSAQLNALKMRQKNLSSELEQRNKKYIDEPTEPEELSLKNKLKMQEEIAEQAFKEAFLEKSQVEFEISKRKLKIKILN